MNIVPEQLPKMVQLDFTINKYVLSVDGLFAGFSFAGALQILALNLAQTLSNDKQTFLNWNLPIDWLYAITFANLMLATILFALRINIAMRIISCIYSAADHVMLRKTPAYVGLLRTGRRIELLGIITFWSSLIPLSFHVGIWFGIFTTTILALAFFSYFLVIRTWNQINQTVPQIPE